MCRELVRALRKVRQVVGIYKGKKGIRMWRAGKVWSVESEKGNG